MRILVILNRTMKVEDMGLNLMNKAKAGMSKTKIHIHLKIKVVAHLTKIITIKAIEIYNKNNKDHKGRKEQKKQIKI